MLKLGSHLPRVCLRTKEEFEGVGWDGDQSDIQHGFLVGHTEGGWLVWPADRWGPVDQVQEQVVFYDAEDWELKQVEP